MNITQEYFKRNEIKPGDIFSEMNYFWIGVLTINEDGIIYTLEGNSDFEIKTYKNFETFKNKCAYKSPSLQERYWVEYHGNDSLKLKKMFESVNKFMNMGVKLEEIF